MTTLAISSQVLMQNDSVDPKDNKTDEIHSVALRAGCPGHNKLQCRISAVIKSSIEAFWGSHRDYIYKNIKKNDSLDLVTAH